MKAGDRVRWAGIVIQHKRDYWLKQGEMKRKSAAKKWLDAALAERGTVISCEVNRFGASVCVVKMDGEEGEHNAMQHIFEVVESEQVTP